MSGDLVEFHPTEEGVSNIFFLSPHFHPESEAPCAGLLSLEDWSHNVILISATETPDSCLETLRTHTEEIRADSVGIISLGESLRSAESRSAEIADVENPQVQFETVTEPGNLTRLGITITNMLNSFEGEMPISICFKPLTTVLQYAELKRVYRFLHVLTNQINTMGATAHYHIDPSAHNQTEINKLKTLFDGVVEHDEEESWQVRTR